MQTAKQSLLSTLSDLDKKTDPGTMRRLRGWLKKFGSPYKFFNHKQEVTLTYYFDNDVEFTVIDWGGTSSKIALGELSDARHVLNNDILADYLSETTLHAFYADCLEFHEFRPNSSSIFAEFEQWQNNKPVITNSLTHDKRAITLVYLGQSYSFSVYKKSK